MPAFSHSLELSGLAFGVAVQPFAPQPNTEEPVPLIDLRPWTKQAAELGPPAAQTRSPAELPFFGGYFDPPDTDDDASVSASGREDSLRPGRRGGPASAPGSSSSSAEGMVRCSNCQGFVNPFMAWASASSECVCNLCGASFELPEFYVEALNSCRRGRSWGVESSEELERRLRRERLELWRGSADFVAPPVFSKVSRLSQLQRKRRLMLRACRTAKAGSSGSAVARRPSSGESVSFEKEIGFSVPEDAQVHQEDARRVASAEQKEGVLTSLLRPCIIFVIDACASSAVAGLAAACLEALIKVLSEVTLAVDVAILLATDGLYFVPSTQPTGAGVSSHFKLLVVGDVQAPFLPLPVEELFFTPNQSSQVRCHRKRKLCPEKLRRVGEECLCKCVCVVGCLCS